MNKQEILNAILTDSQKLAMHFLELLPVTKMYPVEAEVRPGYGRSGDREIQLVWIDSIVYIRIDDCSYTIFSRINGNYIGKTWHLPAYAIIHSTTIPQEVLDLIPDKE